MKKGDAWAHYYLAAYYEQGTYGLPHDRAKSHELYLKAGELGCADAYYTLGTSYRNGRGVELDLKKAKHYYELGAMNGDAEARFKLGNLEGRAENWDRAIKHYIIAAGGGYKDSLEILRLLFQRGDATRHDFETALRAYQSFVDGIKSKQRDEVATFLEQFKYY